MMSMESDSSKINDLTKKSTEAVHSPLRIFVLAKKKINNIFLTLEGYLQESKDFLLKQENQINQNSLNDVLDFEEKIKKIRYVLQRDHMKVAFFGRTSNGKSTVINAVLHDKILPSGMGHTTNCFIQVEGSDVSDEAFLVSESSPDKKLNVDSVSALANALNSEKLGDSNLVKIFWPKNKCPLLKYDVVLVDSPGIDVSPNLDEWIDKYCLDADVFVLVLNAESTLMRAEKAFFHKVNERISKPNIFIINNRWDAASSEPENLEKVRKQHTDRSIAFLCEELNVVTPSEAKDRVFFVSAKEVLNWRLFQNQISTSIAEGFQHRYFEFEDFERKFGECLSKSAVKTKFDQHTRRGKKIIGDLSQLLLAVHNNSFNLRNVKDTLRKEKSEKLLMTKEDTKNLIKDVKNEIIRITEQTELKVSSALNEEIRRLSLLVNDFQKPFSDDTYFLNIYKNELHMHVEKGLGSNMRARLSSEVSSSIEASQKAMIDKVYEIISPLNPKKKYHLNMNPRQNFEILYRINCESLCADFHEDLEFKFSWGIITMIKRFLIGKSHKSLPITTPQTPSNDNKSIPACAIKDSDFISIIEKIPNFGSQSTVGALAIGGFMIPAIGWRIIAISVCLYSVLYVIERLRWTTSAKERAFKNQYVNHATRKLKLIVDLTSANCSHQVQQELTSTFASLRNMMDEVINNMGEEIKVLEKEMAALEECANEARKLKNKASFLSSELDSFSDKYLSDDS